MNEAYMLLKNAIVSKNFLVQVIIETVPVSSNYRSYRNFKAVIELYWIVKYMYTYVQFYQYQYFSIFSWRHLLVWI